ncbi:major facilitator superfamily transporter [Acetobacter malorum DSM 14337]|uniref:Uncharacterized MFS-type transporter AA14337_2647 n=1 Tax=Acetobacter malorum DSM 14337 TaxID=1307910 RepID=A0ABQ0PX03_9PROT|nr:arabinose transporter [Acetobacter malorum]KXV05162.1 hypothetical protein AD930_13510 [Acetobacter malorum]GBQ83657.1 major facilitator superfamily transporter [Acetobacter malorum DSM 14337]
MKTDRSFLPRLSLALFLSYLSVALSLTAVPVYVMSWPGFSNVQAGLAVGIPFLSTIFTRNYAGQIADASGGHRCMRRGLVLYALACGLCMLSTLPALPAFGRYGVLIAGRLLLGLGESLCIVGMMGWGIGLAGQPQAGRVMAWTGAAMYGAFAVGGPVGLIVYQHFSFAILMAVSAALPLVGLALISTLPAAPLHTGHREPFWTILNKIRWPGLAVALQGVGFAALGAFLSLRFLQAGWSYAGWGLTCFGAAFVAMRLLCGHLPDRIGGLKVALPSLLLEAVGLALIWGAHSPEVALVGALLTGAGCSMVYPSLGVEVVHLVPAPMRSTALGGFSAFQDLAYAATGPLAGFLADRTGYAEVFLLGSLCAMLGAGLVCLLLALKPQSR